MAPPTAHVVSITQRARDGAVIVEVMCCYCFKTHQHGAGVEIDPNSEIPDDLGNRVAHCPTVGGRIVCGSEYSLSTVAWKRMGKRVQAA